MTSQIFDNLVDPKIRAAISLLKAHGHVVQESALIYKVDGQFRTRRELLEMAQLPPDPLDSFNLSPNASATESH